MKVIQTTDDITGLGEAPVATIGKFEGVHLGHLAILSRLNGRCEAPGSCCVVVTFDPHPQRVLEPDNPLRLLGTKQERLEAFEKLGICAVVLLPFTRDVAGLSPEEFVRQILVNRLHVRGVVVGRSFLFGKGRAGDLPLLQKLGRRYRFFVDVVPVVVVRGAPVSSTRTREAVTAGDMQAAAELLARPYTVRGDVVKGEGRGKSLGFPTANLKVDAEKLLPPNGVYAVRARVFGPPAGQAEAWQGLMNIGVRPSFGGGQQTVEVHLDGFSGDLYCKQLEVEIVQRIRDEMDFVDAKDLADQIQQDKDSTQQILSTSPY